MRIVTVNVNGIRSAERKGFARWLARIEPWDVVCLQEIKAHVDDRAERSPRRASRTHPFTTAAKRGYSGVALYSKRPASVQVGFGSTEFDAEGRYVEADFRAPDRHQRVLAVGLQSAHASWPEFRFLAEFLPAPASPARRGSRSHPVRRLEHRAPADRSQELAQQPEELAVSCPRNGRG